MSGICSYIDWKEAHESEMLLCTGANDQEIRVQNVQPRVDIYTHINDE